VSESGLFVLEWGLAGRFVDGRLFGVSWDLLSEVGGSMSGGPWLRLGLVPFVVWDVEMTIIWPRSRSSLPLPCSPQ
jgi:hypothetical protein